jgi:geranylgeranyl pyrophosphate synthase
MTLQPVAFSSAERVAIDFLLEKVLAAKTEHGVVRDAMRYAVLGNAQRVRPILALRVARMVSAPADLALKLAAAVELVHCASLVVDDLPCMDDSPLRRGRPAVHVKFGEATAVLAAFGLVALAARGVLEPPYREQYLPCLVQFQLSLLRSLDCSGLIAGQALDLRLPHTIAGRTSYDISELKTVPLFNLAVQAGCVLTNLDVNERALLNCFGHEFGLAFQMSDDLLDGELRNAEPFEEKISTLRAAIEPFGEASQSLEELVDYLHARVMAARVP